MEQQPAPTPGGSRPGWAAPGPPVGTAGADEATAEQAPPFREAPTAELAAPPFAPPPPSLGAGGAHADVRPVAVPGQPPLPPPPAPGPEQDRWRDPVLPPAPPTYDGGSFGGPGAPLPPLPAYAPASPAPAPASRRVLALAVACSALIAALVTGALFVAFDDDGSAPVAAPSSRLGGSSGLDIQALLAKAQPSVVTIHTDEAASSGRTSGAGTGVVVSADGDVLTNAHVVARSQVVRVTLDDGTEYEADVVGSFPEDDVALVRLRGASGLAAAQLGSSADTQVGDEVVAIGNALNLGASPSVTRGIISALDRMIEAPDVTLTGLIQTDAAINPGNSGGPLLNAAGDVIGINTAIAADAQNIGFAIPIDDVKPLIEELRQGRGEITPDTAFLGVSSQSVAELSADERDQAGITASRGAVVTQVEPGSPAARAGLEVGDVVVELDGTSISTADELVSAIRGRDAGDEVAIQFERDGRQRETVAELDRRGG